MYSYVKETEKHQRQSENVRTGDFIPFRPVLGPWCVRSHFCRLRLTPNNVRAVSPTPSNATHKAGHHVLNHPQRERPPKATIIFMLFTIDGFFSRVIMAAVNRKNIFLNVTVVTLPTP